MTEMTKEQLEEYLGDLKYFHESYDDMTRYVRYDKETVAANFPLLARAAKELEMAQESVKAAFLYYQDRLEKKG